MKECFNCKNEFSLFRPLRNCWRCGKTCCTTCSSIKYISDSNNALYFCPLCVEIASNLEFSTNCAVCLKEWKDFGNNKNKNELLSEIEHINSSLKYLERIELILRSKMPTDFSVHLYENLSTHLANNKEELFDEGMMSPRSQSAFEGLEMHEDPNDEKQENIEEANKSDN